MFITTPSSRVSGLTFSGLKKEKLNVTCVPAPEFITSVHGRSEKVGRIMMGKC